MGKPPTQAAACPPPPDREDPAPPSASSADGPSVALSLPPLLLQPWTENPALSGSLLGLGGLGLSSPTGCVLLDSRVGWAPWSLLSSPPCCRANSAGVWHPMLVGAEEDPAVPVCVCVCMYMGVHVRVCMCTSYVCVFPTSLSNPETCLWEEAKSGITILKISP